MSTATTRPDWYSGSDHTGAVARGIEVTIARMDDELAGLDDVRSLERLLGLETEVNWRAFLLGLQGTILLDIEDIDRGRSALARSIAGYRVWLETFDDVLSVYCQSCYTLGESLLDADRPAEAIGYLLRCLPYMHEVYEEPYLGNVYASLERCCAATGPADAAEVFAEAAVVSRGADCASLERLMVAYATCGQQERAGEVLHLLLADCTDWEHIERVRDLARRLLGESGTVN